MQIAVAVGRLHRRPRPTSCGGRWGPSARGEKIERAAAAALRRAWPATASPARPPTRSTTRSRRSPPSGSPRATRSASRFLVYASSWLKLLLPGGVLRGAAQRAADGLLLAAVAGRRRPPARRRGARARHQHLRRPTADAGASTGRSRDATRGPRTRSSRRVRLGLSSVRDHRRRAGRADRRRARRPTAPFTSMADLARRVGLTTDQVEALATAGAFDGFGLTRREALWAAGAAAADRPGQLDRADRRRDAPPRRCPR